MTKIKTAGQLRGFLIETLEDVRSGRLGVKEAHAISKIAAQINQSIATEVSAAIQFEKLGKGAGDAGALIVGSEGDVAALPTPDQRKQALAGRQAKEIIWCNQCDSSVRVDEALGCKSKYCNAGVA